MHPALEARFYLCFVSALVEMWIRSRLEELRIRICIVGPGSGTANIVTLYMIIFSSPEENYRILRKFGSFYRGSDQTGSPIFLRKKNTFFNIFLALKTLPPDLHSANSPDPDRHK
jgi:hypothetical protein